MERSHSCSSVDDNCGIGEHNNHNNINNNNINNMQSNNNNNNNTAITHSPYSLRKAIELRQMRLQRQQREQQYSPLQQQHHHHHQQQHTGSDNDKLRSTPTQRIHHRRKRLQRQVSTELPDDVDFAYAADLEEEDEDYDEHDVDTENDERLTHAYHLRAFGGAKQLPQFQHSTPFSGQPSSLPNCYSTCATTYRSTHHQLKHEESFDSTSTTTTSSNSNTTSSTNNGNSNNMTDSATSPVSPATRRHNFAMLKRDNSTQSESSSRYSSVDSLLEARKPDPEAILINLGFGPVGSEDILSRIPKRFLKPSQVRGIDTEAFVRRLQLASNLADHSVLGYRGLTGNPDIPPSRIVAKIMQRFEVNERKKSMGSIEHTI